MTIFGNPSNELKNSKLKQVMFQLFLGISDNFLVIIYEKFLPIESFSVNQILTKDFLIR